MRIRALIMIVVLVNGVPALAQDEEGLSGNVAFGYLATSGNSESDNMQFNLAGYYNAGVWHHILTALVVKASANDVDTAEAYGLSWKTKYDVNETDYLFGLLAWDKDEFSSYERQTREVFGYGRRFIDRERHVLNAEAGVGLRQADLRDGTSEDEAIVRLASDYHWTITETSEFIQVLAIESGSSNTYVESVSSVSADVWESIALVLSYTIKHNSDVAIGTEKRDTFTSLALEYSF